MRLIFIAVFLLATDGIRCSPSRRFEPSTFEKYLTKARAVLDRVPLIDGYFLKLTIIRLHCNLLRNGRNSGTMISPIPYVTMKRIRWVI